MQLKIRRSQRDAGIMGKTAMFCLDARVTFTPAESASIARYKLQKESVYNSQASLRHTAQGDLERDGSAAGLVKGVAHYAAARMHLNVTVESLSRGQHIECKSLEEMSVAEAAIMEACGNLRGYLTRAASFDGRDLLFDFDEDGRAELIGGSVSPEPVLIGSSPVSPGPLIEASPMQSEPWAQAPQTAMASGPTERTVTSAFQPLSESEKRVLILVVAAIIGIGFIYVAPHFHLSVLIAIPAAIFAWFLTYKHFSR